MEVFKEFLLKNSFFVLLLTFKKVCFIQVEPVFFSIGLEAKLCNVKLRQIALSLMFGSRQVIFDIPLKREHSYSFLNHWILAVFGIELFSAAKLITFSFTLINQHKLEIPFENIIQLLTDRLGSDRT